MTITSAPPKAERSHRRAQLPGRHSRTHLPGRDGRIHRARPETPRNLSTVRRDDVLRLVGAAVAAVAATAWLVTQILPIQGALPFVLIAYVAFLVFYVILISFDDNRVTITDRIWAVVIHSAAVLLLLTLVVVVVFTLARGSEAFVHWNFWVQDLSLAGPLDPLDVGGMLHAAIGTSSSSRSRC